MPSLAHSVTLTPREQVPELFNKYAGGEGALSLPQFSKMYAAFLFRNFDADNSGYLDLEEVQEALKYLGDGVPMQVALPSEQATGEVRVGKPWFWFMYKRMMNVLPGEAAAVAGDAAADAADAAAGNASGTAAVAALEETAVDGAGGLMPVAVEAEVLPAAATKPVNVD